MTPWPTPTERSSPQLPMRALVLPAHPQHEDDEVTIFVGEEHTPVAHPEAVEAALAGQGLGASKGLRGPTSNPLGHQSEQLLGEHHFGWTWVCRVSLIRRPRQ
jgi:hypothetical protein